MFNLVENLTGSTDLISLRSRGKFARPFTKVQEIELRAQEKWLQVEQKLQAKLQELNQRINELQATSGSGRGQPLGMKQGGQTKLMTRELIEEMKSFREERIETQRELRRVRRNLRKDKESLGRTLFLLNTFAVPFLLIGGTLVCYRVRKRRIQKAEGK